MLKAAIAESLRDSPVVVSDVEDGEIFDDDVVNANDDDKNNNDASKSGVVSPNASALTNLGWSCVTTAGTSTKTAGKISQASGKISNGITT